MCYYARMLKNIYANSSKQPLDEHCALVGILSEHILRSTYPQAPSAWRHVARWSGFLHDLGKIDANFQSFVQSLDDTDDGVHIDTNTKGAKKFSWGKYPRHNEISWLLITTWFSQERAADWLDKFSSSFEGLRYGVYWHHAKPIRDADEQKNFDKADSMMSLEGMQWVSESSTGTILRDFVASVCSLAGEPLSITPIHNNYLAKSDVTPVFKYKYAQSSTLFENLEDALKEEAFRSCIRSCVVGADRLVSAMTKEELTSTLQDYNILKSLDLTTLLTQASRKTSSLEQLSKRNIQIERMVDSFSTSVENFERNQQQEQAAYNLNLSPFSVLQGPAGCGKTKIMLQTIALQPNRRAFIFVPRVAIGQGLFQDLIHDYNVTCGVELYTGDMKRYYDPVSKTESHTPKNLELCGTIVITTIDQLCSISLSHSNIDLLTEVMRSTVIFDEYHELFDIAGIALMFLEFIKLRFQTENDTNGSTDSVRTLLVSATPNPFALAFLSTLEGSRNRAPLNERVHKMATFNKSPYSIKKVSYDADGTHPFMNGIEAGEIAVSNIVEVAQLSAIASLQRGISTLCFHSKYTPEHKKFVMSKVMDHFKKTSILEPPALFAGPIIQASLNISTRKLHTDAPTAENFLQRVGRVNRFSTFPSGEIVLYDVVKNGKINLVADVLSKMHQGKRAQAWLNWCISQNLYKELSLEELYASYDLFHASPTTTESYLYDFKKMIDASGKLFGKMVFDPIQWPTKKVQSTTKTLSSQSLRGASYYILPRFYHVENGKTIHDDWLYTSSSHSDQLLTDSLRHILFADESEQGTLLDYMACSDTSVLHETSRLSPELIKSFKGGKNKKMRLSTWKMKSRNPAFPIVLTYAGWHKRSNLERVYLKFNNTWIGLLPRNSSTLTSGM